jgi:hypothetical protein
MALVPAGTVSARVNQLDGFQADVGGVEEELIKKQKMCPTNNIVRSAAAAESSPRRAQ